MSPEKEILLDEALDKVCQIGWGLESDELLENYYSEKVMIIGTTADELFFDLDGMRTLIRRQKEQSAGIELHFARTPIFRNFSGDENVAVIVENVTVTLRINNDTIAFDVRSSAIMEYKNDEWKLTHWHASKPEMVQSDTDTFGIEDWKQKTDALEKLVAERTADLVIKNRELEIETALEKVRSRTMAMRHSSELKEIIRVVFRQMVFVSMPVEHAGFIIDYKNGDEMKLWIADQHKIPSQISIPYFDSPHWNSFLKAKESGTDFFANNLNFEEKNLFYQKLFTFFPELPVEARDYYFNCPGLAISTVLLENIGLYIENFSGIPYTAGENKILMRFGNVFQQAYTRFLDLEKAEAQAREAEIELALERVRARTMAMQHSDELADASFVLDSQVRGLGIQTWGCAFNIYGEKDSKEWFSSARGTLPAYKTPRENLFLRYYEAGQAGIPIHVETFKGEACTTHYEYLCTIPVMGDALKEMKAAGGFFPIQQTDHAVYFKYGYLLFITLDPVPEAYDIFIRFAKVFEQTYTRFLDLQKAEAQAVRAQQDVIAIKQARQKAEETLSDLQAAQKQLIQSEKMASLGELTAGIAHEIQNPLNFVNNFAELSKELLDEMKAAMSSGDNEEAIAISADIIQNLEKINHHGKRADAIVKGMLQHSQGNAGQKQLTDINALTEEYLRLAFHGLRAKDKSFNAALETDYDPEIGMTNIVSQDIGRVVLNLINNALYVVNEKSKSKKDNYQPGVWISTKRSGDSISISVKDNGNGVPAMVIDKIFQPFFTTKPTGQGTGLGLSLSYDIMKAMGGEIKVETEEGAGSTFIITFSG